MADKKKKQTKRRVAQVPISDVSKALIEAGSEDPSIADAVEKEFGALLAGVDAEVLARMEQYKSTTIRVLRDTYQTRPFKIFNIINEMVDRIYATAAPLAECLNPVLDNCLRRETAECLKDLVDIYQRGVAKKYLQARALLGDKVN